MIWQEPSLHEVFVTRGKVERAPFNIQIQIFVPWNTVLIHEPKCHFEAQWYTTGKRKAAEQIIKYHGKQEIYNWLNTLDLSCVKEVTNYVQSL